MFLFDKSKYYQLNELVKQANFNHLFARAVLENHVNGLVYVDNTENPKTCYIIHPYGISLLCGDCNDESFNSKFLKYILNDSKTRNKAEWMQAFPDSWHVKLKDLLANKMIKPLDDSFDNDEFKIVENTRINFTFNIKKYLAFRKELQIESFDIRRTDKIMYENIGGTVIPKYFWNNASEFYERGVGFSLMIEKKPASTAYSAFVFENQLELGIETHENYRGKGFAKYSCAALIEYCIGENLEPVWSCRLENTASYHLAQKLGFEPVLYIPFYKLNY